MDMLNMALRKGMKEAKKFLPTNNSLLIDLDDTSGKSLPKDIDNKPSTAFVPTQVKKEEEEQVVNAISMFGEVEAPMAGAIRTATPRMIWRRRRAGTAS